MTREGHTSMTGSTTLKVLLSWSRRRGYLSVPLPHKVPTKDLFLTRNPPPLPSAIFPFTLLRSVRPFPVFVCVVVFVSPHHTGLPIRLTHSSITVQDPSVVVLCFCLHSSITATPQTSFQPYQCQDNLLRDEVWSNCFIFGTLPWSE